MLKGKIRRQINRLERTGNNDFALILTGGAEAFATHELHQLLRRLKLANARLSFIQDFMFRIGLTIPFLMFAACSLALVGHKYLVSLCVAVIPICVVVLALTQIHVRRNYACMDRSKRLRFIIQQELDRRRRGQAVEY
ncbi:hypothetical protein [Neolewinella antarctica]|uniref:Membrane protein CcdC involved in cytochrome C biogenesis n=1 Tax=Neolewinella antarctica TaxID=442734 RepID=A0ABX0XAT7_9BACT|nr:hypothetical protein [Neolewinella antarctica]NJC26386.1 membrane protein CcdC involved in cytochrome C biogenesis [Neolewinella antarctica]